MDEGLRVALDDRYLLLLIPIGQIMETGRKNAGVILHGLPSNRFFAVMSEPCDLFDHGGDGDVVTTLPVRAVKMDLRGESLSRSAVSGPESVQMRTKLIRRDVRALFGLPARRKAEVVKDKHLGIGLNRWLLQVCGRPPTRCYCREDTGDTGSAHRQEALQHRRYSRNIRINACEGKLREHGQDDVPEHLVSPTYPLFFEGILVVCSQMRGLRPAQAREHLTLGIRDPLLFVLPDHLVDVQKHSRRRQMLLHDVTRIFRVLIFVRKRDR